MMPGIDLLIARDLSLEIKDQLDENTLAKLERELFFQHGMSLKLSIEHFGKLHNALKKYLKIDLKKFEEDCIKKIIQVSKPANKYCIKIVNPRLSNEIFDFYGDPQSRKILTCIMGKSLTVSTILKNSEVLKSPAYRKIENLLLGGLILESGKILINNKRVSQYRCIFEKVNVAIKKDELVIKCILNARNFNESSIAQQGIFEIL